MSLENEQLYRHISQQFNEELEDVRNQILVMGGLVERQLADAVSALTTNDYELAEQVHSRDNRVNTMEMSIDEECTRILARRQPAAGDLRLVVAVLKTATDLERVGDEAAKIGRIAMELAERNLVGSNGYLSIRHMGTQVQNMTRQALDAFARLDVQQAIRVARHDLSVDQEFESTMRQLVTFMMEDPRTISRVLHVMWAARSLERIGDHARNICEQVIYMVEGVDVRHRTVDQMVSDVAAAGAERDPSS